MSLPHTTANSRSCILIVAIIRRQPISSIRDDVPYFRPFLLHRHAVAMVPNTRLRTCSGHSDRVDASRFARDLI